MVEWPPRILTSGAALRPNVDGPCGTGAGLAVWSCSTARAACRTSGVPMVGITAEDPHLGSGVAAVKTGANRRDTIGDSLTMQWVMLPSDTADMAGDRD